MRDLSVLIPARNEQFLAETVADILAHATADTEVIVVLDGQWPVQPLPQAPKLTIVHTPTVIGQRAAVNLAAQLSTARYVMKLDAHCGLSPGFDTTLLEAGETLGPDVTQIPRMYNFHVFDWVCGTCGDRIYQGPTPPPCAECAGTFAREIIWKPRLTRKTDFWRFDRDLKFAYWGAYKDRPASHGDVCDVLSSIGACFFLRRDRFAHLGGLDERHGGWGQLGTEVACKSWLSGGRQVVNKAAWFAHMFRTQGGDFGFPYPLSHADQEQARAHSRWLWHDPGHWEPAIHPLSWLIEKFAPVPDW